MPVCPSCGAGRISTSVEKPPKPAPEPSALDRFFESWAATKNPLLKGLYLLCKALWMVYMAIIAFILWLIAAAPG